MFEQLTEKLDHAFKSLRGKAHISKSNIADALKTIRHALIEADVALEVIDDILENIEQKAMGQAVIGSLNPGEAFTKIVYDYLVELMGSTSETLNFRTQPPAVILVAGLQGAGKTTTVGKLAKWLKDNHKKSVLLASTDVYRPAAIDQLKTLAEQVNADFFPSSPSDKPQQIAMNTLKHAKMQLHDILIIDTAGRLHIDETMMSEVKNLHKALNPTETLFVVDSMTGQDAANTAKAFHQQLPLTGVILTKTDGDARGGAALSVRHITGKPIKFMGAGEKLDALEAFHPDRVASRILGMGDVLTLVEEVQQKMDHKKSEKLANKLKKQKGFDLEDFREQLVELQNIGGMSNIIGKLPGMAKLPPAIKNSVDDSAFKRISVMIDSMTMKERRFPNIINGSRKKRIATGSGATVPELNRLLKQHQQMSKMMKKMSGGNMMRMMSQLKGKLPPGFM